MTQSVSADNEILGQMNFEQLILSRNDSSEPVVTLTVKLNIQNALGDFTSGMPSVLRGLIKNLAPKEIYVTAFVTMGETLSTDILINDMEAGKHLQAYHGHIEIKRTKYGFAHVYKRYGQFLRRLFP